MLGPNLLPNPHEYPVPDVGPADGADPAFRVGIVEVGSGTDSLLK
jgi:hypothetical protein